VTDQRSAAPPGGAPLVVYDGDCASCRAWVARGRRLTGPAVEYASYPEVAARFPEIGRDRFRSAVHLIEPDGRVSRGAEAVFRALALARRQGWLLWLYERVPGLARASEAVYRLVARHRPTSARARPV
jgi:lipase maturation factor 1